MALREKLPLDHAATIHGGTPADDAPILRQAAADRAASVHFLVRAGDPCRRGIRLGGDLLAIIAALLSRSCHHRFYALIFGKLGYCRRRTIIDVFSQVFIVSMWNRIRLGLGDNGLQRAQHYYFMLR